MMIDGDADELFSSGVLFLYILAFQSIFRSRARRPCRICVRYFCFIAARGLMVALQFLASRRDELAEAVAAARFAFD